MPTDPDADPGAVASSSAAGRFRSTASVYATGRPAYPTALIERVAQLCGLSRAHRILDLGCGPGQLAIAFAPFVGSAVALDPEPEMLAAASAGAAAAGVEIEAIAGGSADLGPWLGTLRMVTMGRSFHWMDRPATLRLLDALVEQDGAVVLFDDKHPNVPDNAWHDEYRRLIDRFAEVDAVLAQVRSPSWVRHEGVLLDSPFDVLERVAVIERRRTPVERLVDRALSRSSTSRARLGAKADRLAAEIRAVMPCLATDGAVTEIVELSALIARRRSSPTAR
jgi:SAM-dependent methyltransferase